MPELSASGFEMAIEKLKRHKSPGIDQIPAELIKVGGKTIYSEIHKCHHHHHHHVPEGLGMFAVP